MTQTIARRSAAAALLLLVPLPALTTAALLVWWPGPVGRAVFTAGKAAVLLLPLAWHLLVDRGRIRLTPPRRGTFMGLAVGALMAAAVMVLYHLLAPLLDAAALRAKVRLIGLGTRQAFLLGALYWCLVNALLEEYIWRWFIFTRLDRLLPRGGAVFLAALAFLPHHFVAIAAYSTGDGYRIPGEFVVAAARRPFLHRRQPLEISHERISLADG